MLSVVKGSDGKPGAVYEVQYDGEDAAYEVEDLHEDLASSSLKFIDV